MKENQRWRKGSALAIGAAALALLAARGARRGSAADGGLELAAGREAHRLLSRDLDALARADVRAGARRALAAAEGAKAGQGYVLARGDLLLNRVQRSVDDLGHLAAAVALRVRGYVV